MLGGAVGVKGAEPTSIRALVDLSSVSGLRRCSRTGISINPRIRSLEASPVGLRSDLPVDQRSPRWLIGSYRGTLASRSTWDRVP